MTYFLACTNTEIRAIKTKIIQIHIRLYRLDANLCMYNVYTINTGSKKQ